jgi:RsbT co-antagonist protein rsbRD N-terminal domain
MSVSGAMGEVVAERWIARTLKSYAPETQPILAGGSDPFRNPVGHVIQKSLTTLAGELLGAMDERAITSAMDAMMRLRAVQDISPSQALRFVFELRGVVAEVLDSVPAQLAGRIDELALMAFDKYMACREQIAGLREKELRLRAECAIR